jgi:Arm DNA-binding domain
MGSWEFAMASVGNNEVVETLPRSDLIWDGEVRGLCVRVYPDDSHAFIFVYRINRRQRYIRIGKTPAWSLEAARKRAKELRSIVVQGRDPRSYYRARDRVRPVENVIQYIAENLSSAQDDERF